MKEEKGIMGNSEYERVTPRIGYYIKSKNIARIFKEKCPLLAAGGDEGRINLFSNSLEHMGYFCGHKQDIEIYLLLGHKWCRISCLCALWRNILASGSYEATIKIWNIEDRSIISTLTLPTKWVSVLYSVREGVFVSGSGDYSLIIWSKSTPESSTYSQRQVLRGHTSKIEGIIRLNNTEIISGERKGDLMIWDMDQGLCIRHIPHYYDGLFQMKQHIEGNVVVNYWNQIITWRAANNWEYPPIKQFDDHYTGFSISIEFLSRDLLLRGLFSGHLEFIHYTQTDCQLYPTIKNLHSDSINAIQRIAKNIVITASTDGYLKGIHPIYRVCYLNFKARESLRVLASFY